MNFSATSTSSTTPDGCDIHDFLGGTLDHTTTGANVVLVLLTVVNIITCPLTIALNLLVIIAVKTKARLKNNSNAALGCLAVTDVLMGAIGQPIFAAATISNLQGETSNELCTRLIMNRTVARILLAATIHHLVLINVERYLAIKCTYAYTTMVTIARILASSALVWISAVLTTVPLLLVDNIISVVINNIPFVISMSIIVFCQVAVYIETRRHEKQIAAQQVSVEARQKFLKEKKALKLTTTVLLILLSCYSPLIVLTLLRPFTITSVNIAYSVFFTAMFATMLNSIINPIIYCVRKRQFRVAFIEILFRKTYTQAGLLERRIFGTSNIVAPLVEGQNREEAQLNNHQEIQNSNDNNSDEDSKDKRNENQINDSTRSL